MLYHYDIHGYFLKWIDGFRPKGVIYINVVKPAWTLLAIMNEWAIYVYALHTSEQIEGAELGRPPWWSATQWKLVNITSGNSLVTSSNKHLPEPMPTELHEWLMSYYGAVSITYSTLYLQFKMTTIISAFTDTNNFSKIYAVDILIYISMNSNHGDR